VNAPDLKVNQLVTIEVINREEGLDKLPSRIEEILETTIHISMPMKRGKLLLIQNGAKVSLIFTTQNGVFSASSKVLSRLNDPIPILVVEKPQGFLNVAQKREHVRLDISLPVYYELEDTEFAWNVKEMIKGTTSNVSVGGLYFNTFEQVETGQRLKLEVHLSDKDIMNCNASVRRVQDINPQKNVVGVGVQFFDIGKNEVDSLYKFIFSKQRDWNRKGLL
jgi:c-di-GMP-binding flagellar brake protein YcgR